jgi:Spy/CpxP family protein refolding chaperone
MEERMTLKKTLPGVLILALAAVPVMIGGHAVADDSTPEQTPRRQHGRMMAAKGGGDHGGFGALRGMMRLFRELDLTESQMDQIDAIFEAAKPEMQTLRQQLAENRQAWHESSSPTEFDEAAAREFATGQAALHAEIMVLGMKTRAQVFGVLTPEQLETLQEAHHRGRRGGFGGQFTSP